LRIEIRTRDDIIDIKSKATWLDRPTVDAVEVCLSTLTAGEANAVAKKLMRYLNDCGCGAATVAFLLTAGGTLAFPAAAGGTGIVGTLAAGTAAAIVAKFAALAWSWRLLRLTLDRL
jgi:hypothetical protein